MLSGEFDFRRYQAATLQQEGEERNIGKFGINKLIVKGGQGWETPAAPDEVEVHYTGMLDDGSTFDATHTAGNPPLTFALGQGHVVQGLEIGISTMRKGENAVLTIPPEFAYGVSGSGSSIPPNATLKFDVELVSWDNVRDVCRDGGILKKVVSQGCKWGTPRDADEVSVTFEARLESGDLVSKSPQGGVEFHVKDGHFCSAISKIVRTMRKGEKARATVMPQYAFGENGTSEFGVPPNANLILLIELHYWKRVEDVTEDGKVMKKILKEGEGIERPEDGTSVGVKYVGKLADGTVFDEQSSFEFVIDEFNEKIVPGLEKAVSTMTKGEVAVITIAPEFGFAGLEVQQLLAVVPANSVLVYETELLSFVKEKEMWDMGAPERLEFAYQAKEMGNNLFKAGKYLEASKKYTKAAKFMEHTVELLGVEGKKASRFLKMNCDLNNAACKLKLHDYKEAVTLCTKVLQVESQNIKALYRRAQAYIETADIELAEWDVKKGLELDPHNRELMIELKRLKQRRAEYNEKEARMYSTMFARLSMEPIDLQ